MERLTPRDAVVVSVPPEAGFVHVLRAVTASVASRLRIPYDGIEDLRLAVDEASARLLTLRGGAKALVLRLEPHEDRVELVVALDGAANGWPPPGLEDTWSWQILVALVDTVRPEMARTGPSIRLVKRALGAVSER